MDNDEDRGRVGGYAPAVRVVRPFTVDQVRWSAVWAGVLVGAAIYFILTGLGAGVGLYAFQPGGAVGAPAFWWFIWLFASLFMGGWVAARLAPATTTGAGVWNGTLVWALALGLAFIVLELGVGFGVLAASTVGATVTGVGSGSHIIGWAVFAGFIIAWFFASLGGIIGVRAAADDNTATTAR